MPRLDGLQHSIQRLLSMQDAPSASIALRKPALFYQNSLRDAPPKSRRLSSRCPWSSRISLSEVISVIWGFWAVWAAAVEVSASARILQLNFILGRILLGPSKSCWVSQSNRAVGCLQFCDQTEPLPRVQLAMPRWWFAKCLLSQSYQIYSTIHCDPFR